MGAKTGDTEILAALVRLALAAGEKILDIAAEGFAVEHKADSSPVTRADRAAEDIILDGLARDVAAIPVIAEERMASEGAPENPGPEFFLVDALDGTREFVAGRPDYTVNIALVRAGAPVLGVVYAPERAMLWQGGPDGASAARIDASGRAFDRRTIVTSAAQSPPRIVASVSHRTPATDAFIAGHAGAPVLAIGSSLKFCLVAAGEADLYPRFGRTMEWDIAAGDAVLRAAGGMTRTLDGAPLAYGKWPEFANPDFIAAAR